MTDRASAPARLWARLFEPRDAAAVAAFRILFGSVMLVSALRVLAKGWVETFFVEPRFFFKYWGFEWVQPLSEATMQALFVVLAVSAALVALGFLYRIGIVVFFFVFTYVELTDVTNYLNHYYLVSLLALLLCFIPAHRAWSLDAWLRPSLGRTHLPAWCTYLLRFQVGTVYMFAGLAKLQTDWLIHAQPLNIWLAARTGTPVIGVLFTLPWAAHFMSWAGFLFDTTIAGFLSWKRTRLPAYGVLLTFHFLTWLLFPIGMFPVIMSSAALVFFSPSWPRRLLGMSRPAAPSLRVPPLRFAGRAALALAAAYCLLQVALPLRHRLYGGDVLWHEQGMRFAWKVMVREKNGSVEFRVRRPDTGREYLISPRDYLTEQQTREMSGQPDLILQLAHHIADDYRRRGWGDVEVYADVLVSLNGRPSAPLIDPTVDLARVRDGVMPARFVLPPPDTEPPRLRAIAAR